MDSNQPMPIPPVEELPLDDGTENTETKLDALPVARPEIEAPVVEKGKRGRKPYPRDAAGNIIRPNGVAAPANKSAIKQAPQGMTDEMVGQAIGGVFMLAGLPLGPQMRLFHWEQVALGEAFGPLAREMPEEFMKWLKFLVVLPVGMGVIAPRIAVTNAVFKKQIKREDARKAMLATLAMSEAEKGLSLEMLAKEKEAELRYIAEATMKIQAQQHGQNQNNGESVQ